MNVAWPAPSTEWDQAVARFLRANPGWLAAHPDLYRALTPPARVHGEQMADHMAAMLLRERQHAEVMTEQAEAILAAGRCAATMLARVQEAVVALIAADDVAECLAVELPSILSVDAVCVRSRLGGAETSGEAARLEALLAGRDALFRTDPQDAAGLYREAAPLAQYDVLIRLPGYGVMGLASRDAPGPGSTPTLPMLRFLGCAAAAILLRHAHR